MECATFTWSPTKVLFDLLNVYHKVLLQNFYFKGGQFMVQTQLCGMILITGWE